MPSDPKAVREYADLLRDDFERYISEVQNYFLCLEQERARAFTEAQEVTDDYVRFFNIVSQ